MFLGFFFVIRSFIKRTYFCDYRSHSTVRGQFKDILGHFSLKMYLPGRYRTLLVALTMVTIVVIIARHVQLVNLLCFGVRKLH